MKHAKKDFPEAAAEFTATAADRAEEFVDAAMKKLAPLLEQANEQIQPMAADARKRGAAFASTQMDKAQPAIEDALDKLAKDVLPKLNEALRNAADAPVIGDASEKLAEILPASKKELKAARKEAKKAAEKARKEAKKAAAQARRRGDATIAALKGELELPEKKHTGRKVVGTLAAATALLGAAAVLLRKYLNQTDESGWAAHEPSVAYVHEDDDAATKAQRLVDDAKAKAADLADKASEKLDQVAEAAKDKADEVKDATDEVVEKAQDAVEETKDYGPNAFVGEDAPEGFVIKGNERSMKYHVEGTDGYERTIPDVWFKTEEDAEAAGFTKAQR